MLVTLWPIQKWPSFFIWVVEFVIRRWKKKSSSHISGGSISPSYYSPRWYNLAVVVNRDYARRESACSAVERWRDNIAEAILNHPHRLLYGGTSAVYQQHQFTNWIEEGRPASASTRTTDRIARADPVESTRGWTRLRPEAARGFPNRLSRRQFPCHSFIARDPPGFFLLAAFSVRRYRNFDRNTPEASVSLRQHPQARARALQSSSVISVGKKNIKI